MTLDFTTSSDFIGFLERIDELGLILIRIYAFMAVAPIFSSTNTKGLVRVALGMAMGYLVFFSNTAAVPITYDDSVIGYAFLMLQEFLVGFAMAYVVNLYFNVISFSGELIDEQIGLRMAKVLDPLTNLQTPVSGTLFNYLIIFILIESGGLHLLMAAMLASFETVPIGSVDFFVRMPVTVFIIYTIVNYFTLGMMIALPIIGTLLIVNVSLGILVKVSPKMNIFVVGVPIKLLLGLVILYLTMDVFSSAYNILFQEAYKALLEVIGGLT